jgi:4-carboxymuconolactone decarboxylase
MGPCREGEKHGKGNFASRLQIKRGNIMNKKLTVILAGIFISVFNIDELGKEPSPMPANKSSIELGTVIQTRLVGRPVTGAIYTFTPVIDQFLKGHLFGDIFGRDNLDFQSREIATISALASMEGVNSQLQSHFNVGFNIGLTEAQMRSLISVLEAKVGKREADNAYEVLGKVLSNMAK